MDIEKLQERIDKAQEKIDKKLNTIEKAKIRIEKLNAKLEKCKYHNDEELYSEEGKKDSTSDEWFESWQMILKLKDAHNSITSNLKEIKKTEETLKKYQAQMVKENAKHKSLENIPEILKKLIDEIIEKNDKMMMEDPKETRTNEEIHKDNVEFANYIVINLIARTESVVGEITSWDNLHVTAGTHFLPVFNGKVHGTNGSAMIETIEAGGYNIQRWHLRVLIKKI